MYAMNDLAADSFSKRFDLQEVKQKIFSYLPYQAADLLDVVPCVTLPLVAAAPAQK